MKVITMGEAQKATSPNSVTLVCAKKPNGETNLAAISWWTYLSNRPPMVGIALSDKGYSCELIRENKQFAICIPGEAIAEEAFRCGTVSGRKVDKAAAFGIEMRSLPGAPVQTPVHSKLVFCCEVESAHQAGDHTFFICKVDNIMYDAAQKQLYAWEGYGSLRTL